MKWLDKIWWSIIRWVSNYPFVFVGLILLGVLAILVTGYVRGWETGVLPEYPPVDKSDSNAWLIWSWLMLR